MMYRLREAMFTSKSNAFILLAPADGQHILMAEAVDIGLPVRYIQEKQYMECL